MHSEISRQPDQHAPNQCRYDAAIQSNVELKDIWNAVKIDVTDKGWTIAALIDEGRGSHDLSEDLTWFTRRNPTNFDACAACPASDIMDFVT